MKMGIDEDFGPGVITNGEDDDLGGWVFEGHLIKELGPQGNGIHGSCHGGA